MKKPNSIFTKFFLVLIILLGINLMIFFSSTNINANSDNFTQKNYSLLYENHELRKKYYELEQKYNDIEKELININEIDTYIYSQIIGLDADSNNIQTYSSSIDFYNTTFNSIFIYMDKRSLRTAEIASIQLTKLIETNKAIKKNKNIINYYPTISPIKTSDFLEISSGFGWRKHPIYHTPLFHEGVDISASLNTNVYSTMYGKVDKVLYSKYGYGNRIVIKNSQGFETLYAHLSKAIYVKKGQIVKKGQLIAKTGNTGISTGPHLHYEIRKNNELQDPLAYFYTYLSTELL